MLNFAPSGKPTNNLALRHAPDQKWWAYPDMVEDEVLAFKLFDAVKGDARPPWSAAASASFQRHPDNAPATARPRQSCEHRVSIWLLAG